MLDPYLDSEQQIALAGIAGSIISGVIGFFTGRVNAPMPEPPPVVMKTIVKCGRDDKWRIFLVNEKGETMAYNSGERFGTREEAEAASTAYHGLVG